MKPFDRRFGAGFLATVPDLPGVYHFLDESGTVIYVGKAKRLRRRLGQYRAAGKKKKQRRMARIVLAAHAVRFDVAPSHLEACLREVRDIQALKPAMNVSSAYSFMYPYVGVRWEEKEVRFGFTTKSEELPGFTLFGAFRSRETTAEAYFSLMRLLTMVGHRSKLPKKDWPTSKYTHVHAFRLLPDGYETAWQKFLRGESREALESLVLRLLEHVGARSRKSETQDEIDALLRFWEGECLPLARAIADAGYDGPYPVPQVGRDPLFLTSKFRGDV